MLLYVCITKINPTNKNKHDNNNMEYIYKLGFFAFALWAISKALGIIFNLFTSNKCDYCEKELIPFVDEKIIICKNCIDKESN